MTGPTSVGGTRRLDATAFKRLHIRLSHIRLIFHHIPHINNTIKHVETCVL